MSAVENKAVFLSYASQDAEAARRICEALRAAGVEVWFDQSELRGGDVWDAKIRKQIKECALFVPVISANTQARREGYFRLEWRLAVERARHMDDDLPFLVPVVIDDTKDADAFVPERFREVQWTRLAVGYTEPAFAERVLSLLSGNPRGSVAHGGRPTNRGEKAAPLRRAPRHWGWLLAVGGVALALAGAGWWRFSRAPREQPAPQVLSKSEQLVATARSLYEPWDLASTDDFRMADGLLKQATEIDPLNADAWASLAILSYGHGMFGFDSSNARLELLRTSAERAVKLAPASDRAKFAQALRFRRAPGLAADALQLMRELADRNPNDRFILRQVGSIVRAQGKGEESLIWYDRAAALPGGDPIALFLRAQTLHELDRLDEAEAAFEQVLIKRPDFARAHDGYLAFLLFARGDLERLKVALQRLPARALSDERVAMDAAWGWYLARDPVRAAAALRHITQDYVEAFPWHSPKSYLVGCVHQLAGRQEAAVAEWRVAAQVIEKRLATNPNDIFDRYLQVELMALLGNRPAAEAALRGFEEFEASQSTYSLLNWQIYALLEQEERLAAYFTEQFQRGRSSVRTFPAIFRFHPYLDPYRDRPRFRELAAEADRFFARPSGRGSEPNASVSQAPAPKSVAVLAFDNLSDDKANEYFSDGISEELINTLGQVAGLTVKGRTSAFYFKGRKDITSAEIAQQLGVVYLVRGGVRKVGGKVRITAQLTRAANDEVVWSSQPLERNAEDAFAVQTEIAALIAQNLQLKLGVSTHKPAALNVDAYQLYLEGRELWRGRTFDGYEKAERLFERALTIAPNFARALVGLADVWMVRGLDRGEVGGYAQRDAPLVKKIAATVDRALELEPGLAEVHTSLGNVRWLEWKFDAAVREMRLALALNPNYATAHHWMGRVRLSNGEIEEALMSLRRAHELEPLSSRIADNYSLALLAAQRPEAGLAMAERALALQADAPQAQRFKAVALSELGRHEQAIAAIHHYLAPGRAGEGGMHYAVYVLARSGRRAEANELFSVLAAGKVRGGARAMALLALGRNDEFFAELQPDGLSSPALDELYFWPVLDPVRQDPRFISLLQRVGLTEAHARAQAWRATQDAQQLEERK